MYHPQKDGLQRGIGLLTIIMLVRGWRDGFDPFMLILFALSLALLVLFGFIFFFRHRALFNKGVKHARAVFPNSPMYVGYLQNSPLRKKLKPHLRGMRTVLGADENGVWFIDPKRTTPSANAVLLWKDIRGLEGEGNILHIGMADEKLTVILHYIPDEDTFPTKSPDASHITQELLGFRPHTTPQ